MNAATTPGPDRPRPPAPASPDRGGGGVPGQLPLPLVSGQLLVCPICGATLADHTGGATIDHDDDGGHVYTPGPLDWDQEG